MEMMSTMEERSLMGTPLAKPTGAMRGKAQQEANGNTTDAKFLEKYTYLSLAAFSYLEADIKEAKKYKKLSEAIKAPIPDDNTGKEYKELNKMLAFLMRMKDEAAPA